VNRQPNLAPGAPALLREGTKPWRKNSATRSTNGALPPDRTWAGVAHQPQLDDARATPRSGSTARLLGERNREIRRGPPMSFSAPLDTVEMRTMSGPSSAPST
jgi:hypothetical protein